MVVVNYFPGSFGDRIIAELSGLPCIVDSLDVCHLKYPDALKHPWFYYEKTLMEQIEIFDNVLGPWLTTNKVIGGHRCLRYDFTKLNDRVRVISIDPSNTDPNLVVGAFNAKVYSQFGHYNPKVTQALTKVTNSQQMQYFARDLSKWVTENILPTDTVLDLNRALVEPEYLNSFRELFV